MLQNDIDIHFWVLIFGLNGNETKISETLKYGLQSAADPVHPATPLPDFPEVEDKIHWEECHGYASTCTGNFE